MSEPTTTNNPNPPDDWEELQMMWQAEADQTQLRVSMDQMADIARQRANELRRVIDVRDLREIIVSIIMIPLWIWMGVTMGQPWTWYLTLIPFVWGGVYQWFIRRRRQQTVRNLDPQQSLLGTLQSDRREVQHQINHLGSVHKWYLLPYGVPLVIYFLHLAWLSTDTSMEFIGFAGGLNGFLALVYYLVYRANQTVVRKDLRPRLQTLDGLIAKLQDSTAPEPDLHLQDQVQAIASPPSYGQTWNRLVPTWTTALLIIGGTAVGIAIGSLIEDPDWASRFFNEIIGAVFAFEAAFFGNWWWRSAQFKRWTEAVSEPPDSIPKTMDLPAIAVLTTLVAVCLSAVFLITRSLP